MTAPPLARIALALAEIEWAGGDECQCPSCYTRPHRAHSDDCHVQAIWNALAELGHVKEETP